MSKDIFCESPFTIQYILENKIEAIILTDIYTIKYGFINKIFVEKVCQIFEIEP